ncbi:uncharacterized protein LOC123498049 [Portunus trituberculatus]|uniref:uncharacterized protein LOC123498049 n=1 Tax=Portunus trituberculatus TaxID=210409 RepID=UPI001E1CEB9B|nr:uncharacterized protein LOC123498049 [Portunus trituberculatus]
MNCRDGGAGQSTHHRRTVNMEAIKVTVVVVAVLTVMVAGQGETPDLPDIWKMVEDSYDSLLTVNFPDLDPGATMLVDELYDIKEEKGVVKVVSKGVTTTNNYYTASQQSFLVIGETCQTLMVGEEDNYRLWGWNYDNSISAGGKQNFLYGPSALLRIPRDFGKNVAFRHEATVRDIKALRWTLYHPSNHTIDYYFAAEDWLMPYGNSLNGTSLQAPLLVTVNGFQVDPWDVEAGMKNQTVYYEYTDFKPYVAPEQRNRFLVRNGLECKDRMTLDPNYIDPPNAPDRFQVFTETVLVPERSYIKDYVIYKSWLYYDRTKKLLRFDVNPGMDLQEPTAAYKSIHDYNTGIEYRIDVNTGECQMKALDDHQFGNQIGSNTIGGIIMADPDHLFHLDDKYIFSGLSERRGVKTRRWTAVRDDIFSVEQNQMLKKTVVDYHFSSEDVVNEDEREGTRLPIQVEATVYFNNDTDKIDYRDILNLLNMQTSFQEYDFNPFHVGECLDRPTDRTWLKITFAGDWFHGASQMPGEFSRKLIDYVATKTKSSYVRFPEVQLEHDMSGFVYASMLLLEPAPYLLQFHKLPDRVPTSSETLIQVKMHDEENCAYICLSYEKFVCKSFYKCKGDGKTCYVSNYKNPIGTNLNVKACPHYSKSLVTDSKAVQEINEVIEAKLGFFIMTENFTIELEYKDHDGVVQKGKYRALFESEEINGDDPVFVDIVRDDFYLLRKRNKLANKFTDLRIPKVSYGTCLAKCLGQMSFECETFSYCYDTQDCLLSAKAEEKPPPDADLVSQVDCVVIARSHLNDYDLLEGFVYLGDPKEVHTTLSPERCAYFCDNTADFTCRSFDFCLDSLKCSLYDHHTADAPDTMFNTSKDCMHFSRNALVDFTKHANQKIDGTRDRYIKDTTPAACAQVCENEPDFGCNGFDFCNEQESGGITCFLTQDHYSDDGTHISDSLTCDHYSRDYYEGEDRNTYAHNKKTNYIYGPGDMAGLACSMLVISIGFTFAGVYAYNKYKK